MVIWVPNPKSCWLLHLECMHVSIFWTRGSTFVQYTSHFGCRFIDPQHRTIYHPILGVQISVVCRFRHVSLPFYLSLPFAANDKSRLHLKFCFEIGIKSAYLLIHIFKRSRRTRSNVHLHVHTQTHRLSSPHHISCLPSLAPTFTLFPSQDAY